MLEQFGIERNEISAAFSNFKESDTLQFDDRGRAIKVANMSRIFNIKVPANATRENVIEKLNELQTVLFAEPNGTVNFFALPNDDYFSDQWALKNGDTGRDIHATQAWDIFKGSTNNIIAIIDAGIDKLHPDLQNKVSGGDNGYGNGGHGIHVAGIAAASTNNNEGIAGVDWNAKIHSQRIDNGDDQDMYDAIVDAVNHSSKVIVLNNSWGLIDENGDPRYSSTVRMGFAYAYKMNRVAVAAMGNDASSETQYPAGFGQGIIAVGATDSDDEIVWFSNTGNHIDVSAPGFNILSTYRNGNYPGDPNYHYASGTSMASPHVSGIASLLKGYNPDLYNDDIENIIRISADDIEDPGRDEKSGTGRVNAYWALRHLQSPFELTHATTNGGSIHSNTDTYTATFLVVPGLADGNYIVKRYDVRTNVEFDWNYETHVWGRGVGTNGYSGANPNYGMGWCDVVDKNDMDATLRTFVYKVWTISGDYVGWVPNSPSNTSYNYTLLAKTKLLPPENLTVTWGTDDHPYLEWEASPDLNGNVNYIVLKKRGSGDWNQIADVTELHYLDTTEDKFTGFPQGKTTVKYKVYAIDYGSSLWTDYSNIVSITVAELPEIEKIGGKSEADNQVVNFFLTGNYPNPFNPVTAIRYGLPEASRVSLKIYDIRGNLVETLVNGAQQEGRYSVAFDGGDVASGIYIYTFEAKAQDGHPQYQKTGRMVLIK